jgi:transposase
MHKHYRIHNWSKYNRALVKRGSITFWIEDAAIKNWFSSAHSGMSGRPETYSDQAILLLLLLREIYSLPLRALQGFVESLFKQMGIDLPVPSYTQISRRAQRLHRKIPTLLKNGARNLIFDSTGLKVYGEGEWKVKIHGKGKRRTWRKFHIGIDASTQDVVVWEMTRNNEGDGLVAEGLLDHVKGKVDKVYGDGAYDGCRFRRKVYDKGGKTIVPPPRNATYKNISSGWQNERDSILAEIQGLGGNEDGRKLWKKLSGYHVRSLVETGFSRIKRRFGGHLKARGQGGQRSECACKCLIINKMNELGLPEGSWVAVA